MWLVEVDSTKVDLDLVSCTHALWFSCCFLATISKLWSNVDQEENITSDIVIMLTLQTSHILKNFVM